MRSITKLAGACAVAGALTFAAVPAAEAQVLTFSQGDLFASQVRGFSYLKFWEAGDVSGLGMQYMFLPVGANGEWVPGTPYYPVWISEEDVQYFLNNGMLAATNPSTPQTPQPPQTPITNTPTTPATATPEPLSMILLATGLAGVGAVHRRRRSA